MTLADILNELEKRALEIEKKGTFTGDNKGLASVLLAGIELMEEGCENK